jgi:HAE1 family hydrophobic/amphiphilic exporter-1
MSRFFIDRPVFAAVIAILIIVAGAVSVTTLSISQYPNLAPPVVQVQAFYSGANANVLTETVAAPIEQEVNGVDGMMYMSSTSNNDGSYVLNITFELGTDPDIAQVLTQNRVALALPRLHEEVRRLGVTTRKQSTNFVIIANFYSPDQRFDNLFIANYLTLNVKDILSRIPGVGGIRINPANQDYGMRIWLDPQALKSRNLTTTDVVNALREQNVQVAAGQIGQPPAPQGQQFQYTISTLGRLRDVSQFEDIIVKVGARGGDYTRLKDVARVELGGQAYDTSSMFNGAPSGGLLVFQRPGANALQVAAEVKRTLKELSKDFPEGLEYVIGWDVTDFVMASIEEVLYTLLEAFILVTLVVFLFLQNWRTTLIPILTIPVSIIGTFAVMALLDFSINMLTLLGMVLAIGIVVDDSIVVVENVERLMATEHLPPRRAAIKAMSEVAGPIIGITLVLMAVFIPSAFLPGLTGQMYRQFALTIAATTGFSALTALTLSPALCAQILRPHALGGTQHAFAWGFNRGFERLTSGYTRLVGLAIRRIGVSLCVYLGLFVLAVSGFATLPRGFVPIEDQGYIMSVAQLPDSASLERTTAFAQQMSRLAQETPGINYAVAFGGASFIDNSNISNVATVILSLKPFHERYRRENRAQEGLFPILGRFNGGLQQLQEGIAVAFPPPPIMGLGNTGGFQMQVLDKGDLGLPALQQAANELLHEANMQPGLANLNTRFRAGVPQLYANVDRVKAKTFGVPLQSVFDTMQTYLGSTYVNDFNIFGRVYQVKVQADSRFRSQPEDLKQLEVRNAAGKMVPLGALLEVKEILGPPSIIRFNLYPTAALNGQAAPGSSSGQALALMENLATKTLPRGMGFAWTDMAFQEKRVGNQAILVFIMAVLVVFLILAAQYESWSVPFAVVLAVPTALLGSAAAVWLRGLDNNIFIQIGLVLLVALAAKNAILVVEFARAARARGASLFEAAIDGARLRFRPILMTSLAFTVGVFPLTLATGAGAAARVSLGTGVFGGMLSATLIPIFIVPVFYVIFQGISERFRKPTAPHLEEEADKSKDRVIQLAAD